MNAGPICRECQAPLSADAPEGLCPKCLLRAAMDTQNSRAHGSQAGDGAGGSHPLPDPALLARCFPQLEILELLGQGGMGAVYKARQPALERVVALKILPQATPSDRGFAERFTREARALAKLSHPSIVAVYEFGQTHGLHYLILEFVDGLNLRQIERTTRLTPRQALQLIPQICEALQFAHDEGVVHRDIKPENVLIDKKGRVKITDFGLAKLLGRETQPWRLTGVADVMGTPHYMAPEQVEHPRDVDHRADIYSLGVVFYEMLTGELPLGKFAPPSRKVAVDVRLDEVVLHALEKEPERRYQQASQVKLDVETIARAGPVAKGASGSPPTPGEQAQDARSSVAKTGAVTSERGTGQTEFWKHAVSAMAVTATVLLVGITVYLGATKLWPLLAGSTSTPSSSAESIDLLARYPATVTVEDTVPAHARDWEFTAADIFRLTQFRFKVGQDFALDLGPTDVGIGHCADGAIWAVLVPRDKGTVLSTAAERAEAVAQVWLRFHPREIGRIFPRETVLAGGAVSLVAPMQAVARLKIRSSWQAGGKAMIPPPNQMTVDVDTRGGLRRFFMVDTQVPQAEYVADFR